MRKAIRSVLVFVLCLISLFNFHAFALEKNDVEVKDIVLSQEEFNAILAKGYIYTRPERAKGLIDLAGIGINNDYKLLQLVAAVTCDMSVVKCGFEDIIVQRRASSSSSWTTYHTFDDEYSDFYTHSIIKAVTTQTGYEYRAICTCYAKKNIFSVERLYVESNIIAW